jgi:predicted nucleic acid-binding protein
VSAIADSTPLIHLSAISALGLLQDLFENVSIPPSVFQEVVVQGNGLPGTTEVASAIGDWIQIEPPRSLAAVPEELGLDAGEREAISLALETGSAPLLMDDRGPLLFARSLGIWVVTTPLILIAAKQNRLIGTVKDRLDALRNTGFWMSDVAYWEVLRNCGEA